MLSLKPDISRDDYEKRAATEKLALCTEEGVTYVISLQRFQHGGPSLKKYVGSDMTARFNHVHPRFLLSNKPAARAAIIGKLVEASTKPTEEF